MFRIYSHELRCQPLFLWNPLQSRSREKQLTVNINITDGANVAGYQITVNFDPTALKYVSGGNADYLSLGWPPTTTDSSVTIAGTSFAEAAPDADGTLATVTFRVVEAKTSIISLTNVILTDPFLNLLEVTTLNGIVTVAGMDANGAANGVDMLDSTVEPPPPHDDVRTIIPDVNLPPRDCEKTQ